MDKNTAVGIIGSGAMGAGIAQVAAMAGHKVLLYDNNATTLDRAGKNMASTLQKLQEKGKIPSATDIIQRLFYYN